MTVHPARFADVTRLTPNWALRVCGTRLPRKERTKPARERQCSANIRPLRCFSQLSSWAISLRWSATRCDPKARPRSSAHRVAASGGRALGRFGSRFPLWPQCGLGNADVILRARGAGHEPTEGGPNAVDVESLGVAQPRRGSARGSWAIDRSWRKESGLGACRKLQSARPSRCNPDCAPEKGVGEERPRTKLVISLMRSLVEQQGASGRSKTTRQQREF